MIKIAAALHLGGMTCRFALLGLLALLYGCSDRPVASPAYAPVHLEPFTVARAESACPNGYEVLWRKECVDNPTYSAATLLCKETGAVE